MGFIGAKLNDVEVIEWLKSKDNQSQTIKEALKEKRLREIEPEILEQVNTTSKMRIKRVIV